MPFSPAYAFDMGLSPAKVEETLLPGSDTTVIYAITNCSPNSNLRIQVLVYDWKVDAHGQLMTPKAGTYEYSASSWVEMSPAEFVLKPRQTQLVRGTYKVPPGTKPGDYLTVILFRQRIVIPPVKARSMGQLVAQGMMASLTYITVPPAEQKGSLEGMRFVQAAGKEPARVEIVIKNDGNAHVRPKGNLLVKDSDGKTVYVTDLKGMSVVLRDSFGIRDIPIASKLAPGKYQAVINADCGSDLGKIEKGTLSFEVMPAKEPAVSDKPPAPSAKQQATGSKSPAAPATSSAKPQATKTTTTIKPPKPSLVKPTQSN